jgi:bifunctional non-homologous end joining protein LigD
VWCFDLMVVNGRDIRSLPLIERREKLRDVLIQTDDDTIRFSEEFPDPVKLLKVVEGMGLEGVISKHRASVYVSGTNGGWVKVKSASWRVSEKNDGELDNHGQQQLRLSRS